MADKINQNKLAELDSQLEKAINFAQQQINEFNLQQVEVTRVIEKIEKREKELDRLSEIQNMIDEQEAIVAEFVPSGIWLPSNILENPDWDFVDPNDPDWVKFRSHTIVDVFRNPEKTYDPEQAKVFLESIEGIGADYTLEIYGAVSRLEELYKAKDTFQQNLKPLQLPDDVTYQGMVEKFKDLNDKKEFAQKRLELFYKQKSTLLEIDVSDPEPSKDANVAVKGVEAKANVSFGFNVKASATVVNANDEIAMLRNTISSLQEQIANANESIDENYDDPNATEKKFIDDQMTLAEIAGKLIGNPIRVTARGRKVRNTIARRAGIDIGDNRVVMIVRPKKFQKPNKFTVELMNYENRKTVLGIGIDDLTKQDFFVRTCLSEHDEWKQAERKLLPPAMKASEGDVREHLKYYPILNQEVEKMVMAKKTRH